MTTQTRCRDWSSRTEKDEPFSRAVGAGEKETEGQRDKKRERKQDLKTDWMRGQRNRSRLRCRKRHVFFPLVGGNAPLSILRSGQLATYLNVERT